jgi:L-lactate dehydrogenase (cytochrome)
VPSAFFDYAEAGSYSEATLHANRADMELIKLRQRVLIDISKRSTATSLLGEDVSMPIALAPVAMTGLEHGNVEIID